MLTAQLPSDLAKKDASDRYRWSMAAAVLLLECLTPEGRITLIAGGEDAFLKLPQTQDLASKQDLRQSDLRAMFEAMTWAVQNRQEPKAILTRTATYV